MTHFFFQTELPISSLSSRALEASYEASLQRSLVTNLRSQLGAWTSSFTSSFHLISGKVQLDFSIALDTLKEFLKLWTPVQIAFSRIVENCLELLSRELRLGDLRSLVASLPPDVGPVSDCLINQSDSRTLFEVLNEATHDQRWLLKAHGRWEHLRAKVSNTVTRLIGLATLSGEQHGELSRLWSTINCSFIINVRDLKKYYR